MTFIALLFVAAAAWALLTGRAGWVGGAVSRRDQPARYWLSVGVCVGMALLLLAWQPVR